MTKKREKHPPIDEMILFNEVDGHCPFCALKLYQAKPLKKKSKIFQIAHIYPLNPRPEEIIELEGEPKLSENVNSLENLLAVCPNCHICFDKPRIREEYRKWFEIKKRLLDKAKTKQIYSQIDLEKKIKDILEHLSIDFQEDQSLTLSYKLLRINEKLNDSIRPLTKRTIKGYVVDYYKYIDECFKVMENTKPGKSEQIGVQVKLAYIKLLESSKNQEVIFNALIDWLDVKTNSYSRQACSIIISFFIQSCEVFSDTSK